MSSSTCRVSMLVFLNVLAIGHSSIPAEPPSEASSAKVSLSDGQLLDLVGREQKQSWRGWKSVPRSRQFFRVKKKPFPINLAAAEFYALKTTFDKKDNNGPHADLLVEAFVNKSGKEFLSTGKGNYPAGSIILQSKFSITKDQTVLGFHYTADWFTGMLKREAGYNPDCGDWEFFVLSGDVQSVLARGKIDSCIQCHSDYKATDFVTHAYMSAESE